jgi:hypothetical protein
MWLIWKILIGDLIDRAATLGKDAVNLITIAQSSSPHGTCLLAIIPGNPPWLRNN